MATMLPILKNPNEKAAASMMPAWHPNFRNAELLPDVKVVRTAFFVNGAAILVVSLLGLYFIQGELGLHALREQTATWQQQIDSEKPGSDKAVIQFRKFMDEEKTLLELKQFQSGKIIGSELLLELGESLPPRITLGMVDYSGSNIVLRGTIAGSPDEASGDASTYLSVLGQHPAFKGKVENISLTGITRNPTTSGISFEILLKLKFEQKGAKK